MMIRTGDVVGFSVPYQALDGSQRTRTVWGRITIMWSQVPGAVVPLTVELIHEPGKTMWVAWGSIHTVLNNAR